MDEGGRDWWRAVELSDYAGTILYFAGIDLFVGSACYRHFMAGANHRVSME